MRTTRHELDYSAKNSAVDEAPATWAAWSEAAAAVLAKSTNYYCHNYILCERFAGEIQRQHGLSLGPYSRTFVKWLKELGYRQVFSVSGKSWKTVRLEGAQQKLCVRGGADIDSTIEALTLRGRPLTASWALGAAAASDNVQAELLKELRLLRKAVEAISRRGR